MNYIRALGFFVGGFAAQWFWSTYLPLWDLSPQILFILTMAVASESGPVIGQCCGFGWGLAMDAMGAHVFGANALLFSLAGYFMGLLRRQMDVAGPVSQMMLALLLTPAYFLLFGLVGLAFEHQFLWVGWKAFLLDPFYNCLVALVGFPLARRFVQV